MDFFKYLHDELNLNPNAQQREAIHAPEKRILLEACPGSGKTTTLVARLGYLIIHEKICPTDILTLTFSRFTARDMEKRFTRLFGNRINYPVGFSTIHSFCYRFLFYCQSAGVLKVPQLIEKQYYAGKNRILTNIYYDLHQEYLDEDKILELSNEVSLVKNKMILPSQHKSYFQKFTEIFQKYEEYKVSKNFMDFDDMLSLTLKLITHNKNLYYEYGGYNYINVDEVQDTSLLQHRIIEKISIDKNLFMVGDIDQSIYAFRGAEPEYLLNIKNVFPQTRLLKLETNYRSTKSIVALSNEIIKNSIYREDKNMRTDNEMGHLARIIHVKDTESQSQEVLKIIEDIPINQKVGILYRNNLSGLPIASSLLENGHMFSIRENYASFFRHSVIKDVFAFIMLSKNFNDVKAFTKVYYKIGVPISKKAFQSIINKVSHERDIFGAMYNVYKSNKNMLEHITRVRKSLRKIKISKPEKILDIIENDLQYSSYIKKSPSSVQIFLLIKHFCRRLKTVDELKTLLRKLKDGIDLHYSNNVESCISLLTLHSSKGLEFDKVIIIDLVEGILPTEKALEELEALNRKNYEEDIRLLYVGITRAIKELYIFLPGKIYGKKMTPSRLLERLKNVRYIKSEKESLNINTN